jgi:putative spermidine/putrescine transport system substrate-binding protein
MMRSRKVVVAAVGALTCLAVVGCGAESSAGSDGKASGTINVSTWGGVWTDAEKEFLGDPFTEETGIKVNYQVSGNSPMAPALLQAQSGNMSLDVVFAENAEVLRSKDLLAEFPEDLMASLEKHARPDAFKNYLVNMGTTATIIACNPSVMEKCPTNPEEFWDVKNFPGPRAILNQSYSAMAFALQADGVAQDEVFPMDIDRAVAKLEEIRPAVKVWPSSGSEQQQVLIDKEVGAAIMWNGRAFVVQRDNIPELQMHWSGSIRSDADGLVVMADAPNQAAAFEYIKWIVEHPKNQAQWTEALSYPTPANTLYDLLSDDIADALPGSHKENMAEDDKWINENTAALQKAWQAFLAG